MTELMDLHASNSTLITIALVIVIVIGVFWLLGRR